MGEADAKAPDAGQSTLAERFAREAEEVTSEGVSKEATMASEESTASGMSMIEPGVPIRLVRRPASPRRPIYGCPVGWEDGAVGCELTRWDARALVRHCADVHGVRAVVAGSENGGASRASRPSSPRSVAVVGETIVIGRAQESITVSFRSSRAARDITLHGFDLATAFDIAAGAFRQSEAVSRATRAGR